MPSRKIKSAPKEEHSETVNAMRSKGCNVYLEKSITRNMGNYESAKVTVGVTVPVEPTKEETCLISAAIETADEIVTKELEVQLKGLMGE